MKRKDLQGVLDNFGLVDAELGVPQHLRFPSPTTEQAKGFGTVLTLAAILTGEAQTLPVSLGVLDRLGIQVRALADEPRWLKFASARPGEPIQLQLAQPNSDAVSQLPEHRDVIVVDTTRSGAIVITTSKGKALLIPTETRVQVYPVRAAPDLLPFEAVSAPVVDWVAESGDLWLSEQVGELAAAGDTWSIAVAAGMCAGLLEPGSAASTRGIVAATLRGTVDPQRARPRSWARSLTPSQLSTLERLALAELDRLHEGLEAVARSSEADDADWRADWVEVCVTRQGIEGVALLLGEARRARPLREALDVVDREGRRLRLGIPLTDIPTNEVLRRATLRDPFCWWGEVL
jgi:hypothetical protein